MCLSTILIALKDVIGGGNVLKDREKEIEDLAKKEIGRASCRERV